MEAMQLIFMHFLKSYCLNSREKKDEHTFLDFFYSDPPKDLHVLKSSYEETTVSHRMREVNFKS